MSKSHAANSYDASQIVVLDFPEAVQKRPGMYIGDTDDGSGLHHMVYEVIDNAIDEALAGYCTQVDIVLHMDGSVSVRDNGRGIPVAQHEAGCSAAEIVMTKLHAGGKFDQNSYKVSGGLHGVGVSVVNALSAWLEVTIHRDKQEHYLRFENGVTTVPLQEKGKSKERGTTVRFQPSADIFSDCVFKYQTILTKVRELAFLNPALSINIKDERSGQSESLRYTGGLEEYVKYLSEGKTLIHKQPISIQGHMDDVELDISMLWTSGYSETCLCFTNTIPQRDGGTHLSGFRAAVTRAIQNEIAEKRPAKGKVLTISGDDVREGLVAVLSVKVPDPKFSSQTKDKLVSSEVRRVVDALVSEHLVEWMERNQAEVKLITAKVTEAARIREECRAKREIMRKNVLSPTTLPGKLADCSEKNPALSEIVIVEGDSAGGTAKQGRDRKTQAVLPIRGKLMNVERVYDARVMSSDAISSILATMGCGWGKDCDASKARYHKIILMTDADVDGNHIRTLILTLFYRYMRPLIDAGYLYIAQPPLFGVRKQNKLDYLKDDSALEVFLIKACSAHATLRHKNGVLQEKELLGLLKSVVRYKNAFAEFGKFADAIFGHVMFGRNILDALRRQFPEVEWSVEVSESAVKITGMEHAWAKVHKFCTESLRRPDITSIKKLGPEDVYQDAKLLFGKHELDVYGPTSLYDMVIEQEQTKHSLQRYKGLGEMQAEQLWETTMNPETRTLLQVTIEHAEEAERALVQLMGEEVTTRRAMIEDGSLRVRDMDV